MTMPPTSSQTRLSSSRVSSCTKGTVTHAKHGILRPIFALQHSRMRLAAACMSPVAAWFAAWIGVTAECNDRPLAGSMLKRISITVASTGYMQLVAVASFFLTAHYYGVSGRGLVRFEHFGRDV